jgi:hypothetical protein
MLYPFVTYLLALPRTIMVFVSRDCEKPRKIEFRLAGTPTEIQTEHFLYRIPESYLFASQFSNNC